MIERNPCKFLQSLNAELQSQASRVRDLIGSSHWLSDGEHKESIVKHLIKRYIPDGFEVSSGFALNAENPNSSSKQLDVVVIDRRYEPPLFQQGAFTVFFATTLVSTVSIKSSFSKTAFVNSLENLLSVALLFSNNSAATTNLSTLFFDDDVSPDEVYEMVVSWCDSDNNIRSLMSQLTRHSVAIATTSGLFIRYRKKDDAINAAFYKCPGLASACLISFCMTSASVLTRPFPTDFSTFVTNAFNGTPLGEVQLDPPPDC